MKRIMDANQYGIDQGIFRVSSVLPLYIGRSKGPATFVKVRVISIFMPILIWRKKVPQGTT